MVIIISWFMISWEGGRRGWNGMELISISTIQIPRAGRWDPTVMVRDYLLVPLKFMRCVAGFPKEPGQYTTEPPEVVRQEIFPFMEE
jgi:hypothetical protein